MVPLPQARRPVVPPLTLAPLALCVQASVYVCTQMRPYFSKMSSELRYRHVVFAEAEVDEAEVSSQPHAWFLGTSSLCLPHPGPAGLEGLSLDLMCPELLWHSTEQQSWNHDGTLQPFAPPPPPPSSVPAGPRGCGGRAAPPHLPALPPRPTHRCETGCRAKLLPYPPSCLTAGGLACSSACCEQGAAALLTLPRMCMHPATLRSPAAEL